MIVRPDWKIEGEIQISTWQSIKECTQEYPALLRPLVLVMSRRHHQLWDSTVRNYSNQCQHCGKNNQIYYIHTETGTLCIFEHYSTIKICCYFLRRVAVCLFVYSVGTLSSYPGLSVCTHNWPMKMNVVILFCLFFVFSCCTLVQIPVGGSNAPVS